MFFIRVLAATVYTYIGTNLQKYHCWTVPELLTVVLVGDSFLITKDAKEGKSPTEKKNYDSLNTLQQAIELSIESTELI